MLRLQYICTSFSVVAVLLLFIFAFLIRKQNNFPLSFNHCLQKSSEEANVPTLNHRKFDDGVLLKLTEKDRLIEKDTNPLDLSPRCSREVFLILMVVSSPDSFIRRNAIRSTWGQSFARESSKLEYLNEVKKDSKYMPQDVAKTVFLIGWTPKKEIYDLVKTEAKVYGDVVIGGLHEHYRNLTMKTRLGLKWAYHHCKANYILKTDDDVFINPNPLVKWLQQQKRNGFYSGWCNFNSPVIRDPNNKWYISEEDYSGSNYPSYCLGGGYIMSDDVLQRILAISYGKKLFPMEDLYVGLLVKELGDVEPIDNKHSFNLIFDGVKGCRYNSLYLAHSVNSNDQLRMLLEAELAQRTC